jgi:hypothetical protein
MDAPPPQPDTSPTIAAAVNGPKPAFTAEDLKGFKYFQTLLPMLDRLRDDGCQRDKSHNRRLHFNQYAALELLCLFNPIIGSMRGIVQASTLEKVQQKLGVKATNIASFSEAGGVFDASQLQDVVSELGGQLGPLKHDSRLGDVPGILTLVDGTIISGLAKLVGFLGEGKDGLANRDIKLHTHFELLKGVPTKMDLTAAADSEVANLLSHLLPGRVYVDDRGYACFRLFQGIVDIRSHFVTRLRDNSVYEVIEDRPLSEADKAAGIVSDQLVWLGCESKRKELKQPVRVIKIKCTPHKKRIHNGRDGPEQGEFLLIGTSLLETPAELIGLIYQLRWSVEIFFRFYKQILGGNHLLSHREGGIKIQVYLTIIACMLITLWSGRKPTKRTVEMIQLFFSGWASEKELEAHLAKQKKLDK